MTSFTDRLEEYIAFRRRCGGDWNTAAKRVRPFVAFADAEGAQWISVDLFLRWKDAFGSASTATWADRLSAVRGFATWLRDRDPRTEIPPKGLVPKRYRRPRPYIYSDDEIVRILTEAAALPSRLGLRSVTCTTLFGLLAVTGMRIGKAIGLDDGDVDVDAATRRGRTEAVLAVREGRSGRFAGCATFSAGPDHHCGHTERVCERCGEGLMIRLDNRQAQCQNARCGH